MNMTLSEEFGTKPQKVVGMRIALRCRIFSDRPPGMGVGKARTLGVKESCTIGITTHGVMGIGVLRAAAGTKAWNSGCLRCEPQHGCS
jgi:hypothetical protein